MANNFRLGTEARNAACNGIVDLIDAGTPPGHLTVRTSTQPANVADAENGTLLGTLTFSANAFGNAATGVATAAAITSDASADASGTAGHFRVYDAAGTKLCDGTSGATSGYDMNFDNAVIVAGGVIAVSSFTVTVPIS